MFRVDAKSADNQQKLSYLTNAQIKMISDELYNIIPPQELKLRPKSIKELSLFKARDRENWIMYYSVPLLIGRLYVDLLKHWIQFVAAMYILHSEKIAKHELLVLMLF